MAKPIASIAASVNFNVHATVLAVAQMLASGEHVTSPVCTAGRVGDSFETIGNFIQSFDAHDSAIDAATAVIQLWLV